MVKGLIETNRSYVKLVIWTLLLALTVTALPAVAAEDTEAEVREKLIELGEEQLLMFYSPGDILITSSARRPQPMKRATSAMYVITAEDIRQAGVTKLDDLMRLVPGMDVAHASSANGTFFSFSVRGFAKPSSERIQVLVDGRPLYNPYRGGVELSVEPIFLDNIERIEIIRGSGGVVWGVNAMNGVVNIITKKPADTQGGLIYGGFGTRATQEGFLRYGGSDSKMDWRATVGANHDNGFGSDRGNDIKDYFKGFNTTGRADLKLSDDSTISFAGGHRKSTFGFGANDPIHLSLQYSNITWNKQLDDDESLQIRWSENYYDRTDYRYDQFAGERMVEFQHNFVYGDNHNIVWGADYTQDRFSTTPDSWSSATMPSSFRNDQASAFIQDEITLRDDLWLTIGYRGHHNELTNFDWAGNVALVHEIAPKHFVRAAVSKSFRRPILFEVFRHKNAGNPTGNDNLLNEELISYELGYRGQLQDNLELNIEGFLNQYRNLIGTQNIPPKMSINSHDIKTYGVETAIDWRPKKWWLVRASHSYEFMEDESKMNDQTSGVGNLGIWTIPKHKVGLTNRFYLDDKTTLNTQMFWSDTYFNRSTPASRIPPFFRWDIRLAKRLWNDNAEIAFGVTNLTNPRHYEGSSNGTEVPRIVYFQFFYKF